MSAYGIALADAVEEAQEPFSGEFKDSTLTAIRQNLNRLYEAAADKLAQSGSTDPSKFIGEFYANMRYQGSDTTAMILKPSDSWDLAQAFEEHHQSEFGFKLLDRPVLVEDLRVRVISPGQTKSKAAGLLKRIDSFASSSVDSFPASVNKVYFNNVGLVDCPLYLLDSLSTGARLAGPASIVDSTQTIVVEPHCVATILEEHVAIDLLEVTAFESTSEKELVVDPVQLRYIHLQSLSIFPTSQQLTFCPLTRPLFSIFGHRFVGVAEQMGRMLQKTAVSVNIKERESPLSPSRLAVYH